MEYAPEKDKNENEYKDELYNFQKTWTDVINLHPMGGVSFSSYMPFKNQYSTYYARSAFKVDTEQDVIFNISRSNPIKIWLDGQLIFENDQNGTSVYDYERVQTHLNAGEHTLFVKSARLNNEYSYNKILNVNNYYYSEYYSNNYSTGFGYYYKSSFDFLIRLTDVNYKKVSIEPIAYKKAESTNKYETSLKKLQVIENLEDKISKASNPYPYYYILSLVYQYFNEYKSGEEYFYYLNKKTDNIYTRYLLANFMKTTIKTN
ncbi:MAG: hypothetical protein LRY27_02065 [Chitinophagales bacterium]|nr:hypothetical protein [Chitinophagales bacterium]